MDDGDGETDLVFPGFTEYANTSLCGLVDVVEIPSIRATFLGEWEISLCCPLTVSVLSISSYLIAMILALPTLGRGGWVAMPLFTILFLLFYVSYVRVISDGPGYFPFYYPLSRSGKHSNEEGSLLFTDECSPSGIVSHHLQAVWSRRNPKPNRCILSSQARRIVIRPDHFCDWTQTWIGKRNFKFFVLFSTWGFVYIFVFVVILFAAVAVDIQERKSSLVGLFFLYMFFGFLFLVMTGLFMCSHNQAMCENTTAWEDWNGIAKDRFDRGCLRNTEDVCGGVSQWYCWCCPTSPWKGKSNEALIQQYTCDYGRKGADRDRSSFL
jgi:hypothetical protein